jgi:drug/metabolite transporter (DMT)-like permease
MFYLLITIFLNVVIFAIFKVFPKYKIDSLQAIVANYCVCIITGSLFIGHIPFTTAHFHTTWFPWALLMGCGFISVFNLIAYSTKIDGITTTTIANKLSLVIPAIFSIYLYHEAAGAGKIIGIVLALPAVYLTSRVKGEDKKAQKMFWPVILFISSGLLDTLVKYVQVSFLPSADVQATYTIYCFSVAGTIGIVLVTTLLLLKKITFSWRNIVAGICVGIPNYFSIYYLIRMLNSTFLQSSAAIPVVNIGILAASAFTAILFFREKINALRITGLILSIIAILLIAFGDK